MKKQIVGITAAAMLFSAAGGVSLAQSPSSAAQPEKKPAADASQAANPATGGTSPASQPPATTPAEPVKLTTTPIVIEAVTGRVRYQLADAKDKVIAKAGDKLQEGVKVSLGPDSALRLRVGDSQLLTFDHMGTFVVTDAVNDGKTDITRIKMTMGRVSFDVKKTRYANDVVIETPDMTLAIKGTSGAIEYTPGQPTIAVGAQNNRGRIELDYWRTGQKVVMTRNEKSSTSVPDPAVNFSRAAVVETATESAREKDEVRLLKRTEGSTQAVPLDVGDINNTGLRIDMMPPMLSPRLRPSGVGVPGPRSSLHLDTTTGYLFETTPPLETSLLRQAFDYDPAATDGGAAILTDAGTGFRRFIYLESSDSSGIVKNRFTSLAIDSPITHPEFLGEISSVGSQAATPLLRGLGALGNTLYASGRDGKGDAIYRVDLARFTLEQVMSPGLKLEGTLGGVNERGTLVAFAHDPGAGPNASLLQRGAIIEMDPRNNYLASAYSALNSSFGEIHGITSNPDRVQVDTVSAITGLSADTDSVTLSAIAAGAGKVTLLRYETSGGTPRLAEVRYAPDGFTTGLGSETTTTPPHPVALRDPTGPIDMVAINARFAMMAYSPQALSSGVVERALRSEILKTAANPGACAASGALNALPTILARHTDERAGIGRTVSEFRTELSPMHPCLPGMPMH